MHLVGFFQTPSDQLQNHLRKVRRILTSSASEVIFLLFVKLLSDSNAAVQATIAGKNFPTSPRGDGANQKIDRASLNALVSAFVADARRVLVIRGIDRLVEIWIERGSHFVELGPRFV